MDVIAVTTIYDWVAAPVGLILASGDRRRRADTGPSLGFRAPRAAGVGAPDRLGADRDRRHHAAARRLHARAVGGVGAGATRQGLDLVARRAHRGRGLPAADGTRGALLRFPRGSLARRRLRNRGTGGHRVRADPAAGDGQPCRDGAADGGRGDAGAVRGAGGGPRHRRADVRRSGRRTAGRSCSSANASGRARGGAAGVLGAVRGRRADRRDAWRSTAHRGAGAAGDGGRGRGGRTPRRRRAMGRIRFRDRRRWCAPELLATERAARADGNRHGVRHLHAGLQHAAGGRRRRDRVVAGGVAVRVAVGGPRLR